MAQDKSVLNMLSLGKLKATLVAAAGKPGVEVLSATGTHVVRTGAEVAAVGGSTATRTGLEMAAMGATAGPASLFNMTLLGGFGVVSAITNQIEYQHERANIRNFYLEEIASKHGKPQNQVADADLAQMEKENTTIAGAVDKERKCRNVGIGASFLASVAVYALMHALVPGIAMGLTVPFAAKVAVSVLSYLAIKSPLVKAGEALFGLNTPDTHDRIMEIAKDRREGKAITREQVIEVFISANKDLATYVKGHFGRAYEELPLADKVKVAEELAKLIPADKMAHSINLGMTNATELAFAVEGDMSGVLPKAPEKNTPVSRMQQFMQTCRGMVKNVTGMFGAEKADPLPAKAHPVPDGLKPDILAKSERGESPIIEMNPVKDKELPTQGYVERLGLKPTVEAGHARKIAEQAVLMDGSPTLQ